MGSGFTFKCGKCDYKFEAMLGIGMLFPIEYRNTIKEIKEGVYGEEYKQFFEDHPNAAVNCEMESAVCTKCNKLQSVRNMTLYLPQDEDDDPEEYLMAEELEDNYIKCKEYEHKCPDCSSPMKIIDLLEEASLGTLKCPECGGELMLSGDLNWD